LVRQKFPGSGLIEQNAPDCAKPSRPALSTGNSVCSTRRHYADQGCIEFRHLQTFNARHVGADALDRLDDIGEPRRGRIMLCPNLCALPVARQSNYLCLRALGRPEDPVTRSY
jgi:hypothetical protein